MKTNLILNIPKFIFRNQNRGLFSGSGKIEKATNAHSLLLADQQVLYELEIHCVKPEQTNEFEKICADRASILQEKNKDLLKLAGCWRSEIGELDKYVHLWRYKNYDDYSLVFERLRNDEANLNIKSNLSKLIRNRDTQVCLSFTYWGEPQSRTESHIYEMRSYALKPGSLIEWGNYWSKGIKNRLEFRCAGMFTQIGPIYHVHHIWAYRDLASRKESREKMWNKPGWDKCVANTVPLIRKMDSKIMTALPFSPTK